MNGRPSFPQCPSDRRLVADLRRAAKAWPGLPACITSLIASGAKPEDGDKNRPFFLAILAGSAAAITGPSAGAGPTGRSSQCNRLFMGGTGATPGSADRDPAPANPELADLPGPVRAVP